MPITFPRDFPDFCFTGECTFQLQYQQAQALAGSATPQVADLGPAYWVASYQTDVLTRAEWGEWAAWFDTLRGGLRTFKGVPALWRWPRSRPKGFTGLLVSGVQWTGSGNLSVIGATRETITVNQLPNGLVLAPGDWLSIPVGTKQHLHRIVEGGTVASNARSLTVEPTIRPGVTTGIAVKFDRPWCDMVLTGQPSISRRGTKGGSISFSGQQVLI